MDKRALAICAAGVLLLIAAVWKGPDDADDFRQFYRAASQANAHESVYAHPSFSPATHRDFRFLPFNRIPSYAAALRPLALLPYRTARRVWIAAIAAALLGCLWLIPIRRDHLAMAFAWSLPVALTLVIGQDIGFVLLIAFAAARVYSSGREFSAGLLASLLAIKLTYLPAVGLVFLAKSRRGGMGLASGALLQLAASFAVEGNGWVANYTALLNKSLVVFLADRMPTVRALAISLGLPETGFLAASVVLFVLLFIACRRLSFNDALILALPVGLVASPYGFPYDTVVAIPLLISAVSTDSWTGLIAGVGLTPLPYFMMMTEHPLLAPVGSAIFVISTLFSAVRFYRTRTAPDFAIRMTGSVNPLSSGTAISSIAS